MIMMRMMTKMKVNLGDDDNNAENADDDVVDDDDDVDGDDGDKSAEVVAAAEVLDAGNVFVAHADDPARRQGEVEDEVGDDGHLRQV